MRMPGHALVATHVLRYSLQHHTSCRGGACLFPESTTVPVGRHQVLPYTIVRFVGVYCCIMPT
jgi:hypothetical protein